MIEVLRVIGLLLIGPAGFAAAYLLGVWLCDKSHLTPENESVVLDMELAATNDPHPPEEIQAAWQRFNTVDRYSFLWERLGFIPMIAAIPAFGMGAYWPFYTLASASLICLTVAVIQMRMGAAAFEKLSAYYATRTTEAAGESERAT